MNTPRPIGIPEKIIPFSLQLLESGTAGVKYEIFPMLLASSYSFQELTDFGENMIKLFGNTYSSSMTGSVLWVIYKNLCEKDIKMFVESVNPDNFKDTATWLLSKNKDYGLLRY
jgi:hypothetical protein